jgi:5-methylcytosine-specific restriction endonuclease McrA
MKPWARKFYKSMVWIKCRDAYFLFQNGLCERCGNAGKIVHHKIYLIPANIDDPQITLNWDNLEVLCRDCHNKEHGLYDSVQEGLKFDKNGQLIKIES